MATRYDHITSEQSLLISNSPMFFVATTHPDGQAGPLGEGPVNVSPKGDSRLTVLDEHRVAYVDFTGSGNQTAFHTAAGSSMTIMVCSFEEENAGIVRLFGTGSVHDLASYPDLGFIKGGVADEIALPERQVIEMTVTHTITSCGYGVPVADGFRPRTRNDRGRAYK